MAKVLVVQKSFHFTVVWSWKMKLFYPTFLTLSINKLSPEEIIRCFGMGRPTAKSAEKWGGSLTLYSGVKGWSLWALEFTLDDVTVRRSSTYFLTTLVLGWTSMLLLFQVDIFDHLGLLWVLTVNWISHSGTVPLPHTINTNLSEQT